MPTSLQITQLFQNIAQLGARKVVTLAVVAVMVVAAVVGSAYFLAGPAMHTIYSGLSPQDVAQITAALSEEGVPFDVNDKRTAVLVPSDRMSRARALLAQKGLPASSRAGYELFDQLGSIGLTSFMQEVTRVRALEGEVARTIQAVEGVSAARVHLVLQDPGSFRRQSREPSGSVLLRLDERWQDRSTQAVRQIVAAAVPGMKLEQVSIASTDGQVLASGGDGRNVGNVKLAQMEHAMGSELEQRAGRTLATAIGQGHYQVAVTVRLDIDQEQTSETSFDPKSRVERSVKIVKQSGSSEDGANKQTVGVESNIPEEKVGQSEGEMRRQKEDRREELINYELNSTTRQKVREGYRVRKLTIAAVIDRKRLRGQLGEEAKEEDIKARLDELRRLIAAATGARLDQVDHIEISAVDFPDNTDALEPIADPGMLEYLKRNIGTAINALTLLAIISVVVWFGVRPLTRVLSEPPLPLREVETEQQALDTSGMARGLPSPDRDAEMVGPAVSGLAVASGRQEAEAGSQALIPGRRARADAIRERLSSLVDSEDAEVTKVFKTWIQEIGEG